MPETTTRIHPLIQRMNAEDYSYRYEEELMQILRDAYPGQPIPPCFLRHRKVLISLKNMPRPPV